MNSEFLYVGVHRKIFLNEKGVSFLKEELEKGNSYSQIAKIFDINPDTLANLAKENGISKDNRRKFTINHNYFDKITTPEQAYWLGFLSADGYVDQKRGIIVLGLQPQDKYHIEKFLKAIGSNKPVKNKNSYINDKEYTLANVIVNSKHMANKLRFYGLYAKKSLTFLPPNSAQIPRWLIKYWLLGYFDGDGGICIGKSEGKYLRYSCNITGTKEVIDFIQDYVGSNIKAQKAHRCKNNTYTLRYTEGRTKELLDHLYDTNIIPICLERKYKLYQQICEICKDKKRKVK